MAGKRVELSIAEQGLQHSRGAANSKTEQVRKIELAGA